MPDSAKILALPNAEIPGLDKDEQRNFNGRSNREVQTYPVLDGAAKFYI